MNFIIGALMLLFISAIIVGTTNSIWNFTKKIVKRIFGEEGVLRLIIIINLIGLIIVFYFIYLFVTA